MTVPVLCHCGSPKICSTCFPFIFVPSLYPLVKAVNSHPFSFLLRNRHANYKQEEKTNNQTNKQKRKNNNNNKKSKNAHWSRNHHKLLYAKQLCSVARLKPSRYNTSFTVLYTEKQATLWSWKRGLEIQPLATLLMEPYNASRHLILQFWESEPHL